MKTVSPPRGPPEAFENQTQARASLDAENNETTNVIAEIEQANKQGKF